MCAVYEVQTYYNKRAFKILSCTGISTILLPKIISKNAHVDVIYLLCLEQSIYRLAWAIVYYWVRAVESLSTVIFNVPTPLHF